MMQPLCLYTGRYRNIGKRDQPFRDCGNFSVTIASMKFGSGVSCFSEAFRNVKMFEVNLTEDD